MDLNWNLESIPFIFMKLPFFLTRLIVDSKGAKSIMLWPTAEVLERLGLKVQFKSVAGNLYLTFQTQSFAGIEGCPMYDSFGLFLPNFDARKLKSRN